jgi:ribonuclease D
MNIVTQSDDLSDLCQKLDRNKRFAIDLEFIPENTYRPVLCLIQVATDNDAFIIDPLVCKDLEKLWKLVGDPSIQKIIHAAQQDLSLIYKSSGLLPANIFDAQIAAGFAGFGFPIGLGKLLNQLLGITIAKTESFTNWLDRPLSKSQLTYALEDVCHLPAMADKLVARLESQGRLSWVLQECEQYAKIDQYVKTKRQEFTKIKGANALSKRSLAVLDKLCELREQEASRTDRPLKFVLTDNALIELSKKPPTRESDIHSMRGVRMDQVKALGTKLFDAVNNALALPDNACPSWPSGKIVPKSDVLVADMLYAILKVIAYEHDIATELVGTRDDIQMFVRLAREGQINGVDEVDFPDLAILQGWRFDMAGKALCKLIASERLSVDFNLVNDPPVKLRLQENCHLDGKGNFNVGSISQGL